VRAELVPLDRVQRSLQQSAEDGRLDVAPKRTGRLAEQLVSRGLRDASKHVSLQCGQPDVLSMRCAVSCK
jgi:hypothetical protein